MKSADEIADRLAMLQGFDVDDVGERELTVTEYRRDSAYDVINAFLVHDLGPNQLHCEVVDTVIEEGREVESTQRFTWPDTMY